MKNNKAYYTLRSLVRDLPTAAHAAFWSTLRQQTSRSLDAILREATTRKSKKHEASRACLLAAIEAAGIAHTKALTASWQALTEKLKAAENEAA